MVLIKNNVFHAWRALGRDAKKEKLLSASRCLELLKEDFIIAYLISHQFRIIRYVTKFRSRFVEATNRVILTQRIRKENLVKSVLFAHLCLKG